MTAIYEKGDVRFLYPENWQLSADDDGQLPWQISLESPSGGLWSVGIYPAGFDSVELISSSVLALKQQYKDVETADTESDVAGVPAIGVDAYFYCLDFLVTAQVRVVAGDRYTYVFYNQAESREFDETQPVYHAIATSLMQNAPGQG